MEWTTAVEKLILEMLANRTSPSTIQKSILSFCRNILPNLDIAKKLPCRKHIQDMQTVQLIVAKLLAGKEFGDAVQVKQFIPTRPPRSRLL